MPVTVKDIRDALELMPDNAVVVASFGLQADGITTINNPPNWKSNVAMIGWCGDKYPALFDKDQDLT